MVRAFRWSAVNPSTRGAILFKVAPHPFPATYYMKIAVLKLAPLAMVVPTVVWAVGAEVETQPIQTATTLECSDGTIYADASAGCVAIQDSVLDDDLLYEAARELAHFGRLEDARQVLGQMSDPSSSRVQTYLGFVTRLQGDFDTALIHYQAALEQDPNNILARSYLGMAYIARGEIYMAHFQLQQIRYRGAQGSWPERALAEAIRTGNPLNY